jgi:hypothetical protein
MEERDCEDSSYFNNGDNLKLRNGIYEKFQNLIEKVKPKNPSMTMPDRK